MGTQLPEYPTKIDLCNYHLKDLNKFIKEVPDIVKQYNIDISKIKDHCVLHDNVGWSLYIIDMLPQLDVNPNPYLVKVKENLRELDNLFRSDERFRKLFWTDLKHLFHTFTTHHSLYSEFVVELNPDPKDDPEGFSFVAFYNLYLENLDTWKFIYRAIKELGHDEFYEKVDDFFYNEFLELKLEWENCEAEMKETQVVQKYVPGLVNLGKVFGHPDYYVGNFWWWKTAFEVYQDQKRISAHL